MKTMSKLLSILFVSLFIISCSGDDGTNGINGKDGATGPAGATGATGPAGSNGTNGTNGVNGNANVIASAWINANWNLNNTTTYKGMSISVTEVTYDVLMNSLVMVYAKQYGTSSLYPLPSSGRWSNVMYSYNYSYLPVAGVNVPTIYVYLESKDGVALTDLQYDSVRGNQFRYFIVPRSAVARLANRKPAVDDTKLSYDAFCEKYQIEK